MTIREFAKALEAEDSAIMIRDGEDIVELTTVARICRSDDNFYDLSVVREAEMVPPDGHVIII